VALAITVVLLCAVAACGNSKQEAAPTTTTAPTANGPTTGNNPSKNVHLEGVPGVTDTEIRVGGVASVTNPLGGKYGDAFKGVQAYLDMVNANGGIYGRQIKLVSQHDDKAFSNLTEVQALLSEDNVFAVLPVATLQFTGADLLVQKGVPTFGWTINPEWGGTKDAPRANLFGQTGSYLCFTCANPGFPWLVSQAHAHKVGLLAYAISESTQCADGTEASLKKYGPRIGAKVVYTDQTLQFAQKDLSVQVSKMKQKGVDFVATCMDTNGVVTLAKEMKKQRLDAVQSLPNAYDHDFLDEFGDLFENSFVRTDFASFELPKDNQPEGEKLYLQQMDKEGFTPSENSVAGWLNADLFVTGLKKAGPNFSQQKLIDAINSMTKYDADGFIYPVNWTRAHYLENDEQHNCQFFSVIKDSKFVPKYSRPGKPFVCVVVKPDSLGTRYTADN
jgi:ABC-type branched-subunit amino acid transport system substrate-binding protein